VDTFIRGLHRFHGLGIGSPHPPFGHLLPEEKGGGKGVKSLLDSCSLYRSHQQTLGCKPHDQNLVPRTPNLAPQRASAVTTKKICVICVICGYIHPRITQIPRIRDGSPHPPFGHLLPEAKGGVLSRNPKAPNARPQRQTQNKICVICVICGYVFCVICGYIWAHLP